MKTLDFHGNDHLGLVVKNSALSNRYGTSFAIKTNCISHTLDKLGLLSQANYHREIRACIFFKRTQFICLVLVFVLLKDVRLL